MVKKCDFCGRLFNTGEGDMSGSACPLCQAAAKRNDYPPPPTLQQPKKKFVESDGFFDEKEFLSEDKNSEFFESDHYNC